MSPREAVNFPHAWRDWWARPSQLAPPGEWSTWLVLAGRFFGKTRTGAQWIHERVKSSVARYIALVAPTSADARDVMVQGPAGILATAPPGWKPIYQPSVRRLTWPNGTTRSGSTSGSAASLATVARSADRRRDRQKWHMI